MLEYPAPMRQMYSLTPGALLFVYRVIYTRRSTYNNAYECMNGIQPHLIDYIIILLGSFTNAPDAILQLRNLYAISN